MISALAKNIGRINKPQGPRTLRRGSAGLDVARVQNQLNCALTGMPPLWVDGIFGAKTTSHIRTFQMRNTLAVDGIVGPQTRGRLESCTC